MKKEIRPMAWASGASGVPLGAFGFVFCETAAERATVLVLAAVFNGRRRAHLQGQTVADEARRGRLAVHRLVLRPVDRDRALLREAGGEKPLRILRRRPELPWWLLGTSMVATSFSSDTPLAVTGIVIKDGIAGNCCGGTSCSAGR